MNDRVSCFYWTRRSKQCFLTCFSYSSCYFLIQVFLQNHYLLISSCLSRLHGNPIFLSHFLIPLALQASTSYMHSHVSGTERMGFSKQDARGKLVVASLPANLPFSAFLPKVSAANIRWTEHNSYLSFSQKSLD